LRGSIKLGSNPHSLVVSLDTLAGLGFSVFERSWGGGFCLFFWRPRFWGLQYRLCKGSIT